MSWQRALRAVLRGWWILVTTTVVGALVAAWVVAGTPQIYTATTQSYIAMLSDDNFTSVGLIQSRMQTYLQVATTPKVLDPVIAELGLNTTAQRLGNDITVTSPQGTVLINVTVTDGNADQAAAISNAVSAQLGKAIEDIEAPRPGQESPVRLSLVNPAQPPPGPVGTGATRAILLGGFAGLVLGLALVLLRALLDTSIRSTEEIERFTSATPLGLVPYEKSTPEAPLGALLPASTRSESFRSIRTNLQYTDVDNPPRVIVITSAVPGEGKTTTACNVAIALAQAGNSVVLVDADLRRPKVAAYLGVENAIGLTDVLAGQAGLDDSLVEWNRGLLSVLPAGAVPPNPSELLGSQQMVRLMEQLREHADYVVLDAPPLLPVTDAAVLSRRTDGAVIVTRYGHTTMAQLRKAMDALARVDARLLGTVLNRVPRRRSVRSYDYHYGYGGYGYRSSTPAQPATAGAQPGPTPAAPVVLPATEPMPAQPAGSAATRS